MSKLLTRAFLKMFLPFRGLLVSTACLKEGLSVWALVYIREVHVDWKVVKQQRARKQLSAGAEGIKSLPSNP